MSDLLQQARAIVSAGYTELRIGSGILDPEHWPGDGALVLDLPATLASLERLERLRPLVAACSAAYGSCGIGDTLGIEDELDGLSREDIAWANPTPAQETTREA